MTRTISKFIAVMERMGSDVTFHREDGGVACPCRTPEGFRDPAWHRAHPADPVCNEQGFLTVAVEFVVKASVQPAMGGIRRLNDRAEALLGDVQRDDMVGIFPCEWNGNVVDFEGWSEAGEDYILYDGKRFMAVATDKVPDVDGDPSHHWEVGLRLIRGGATSGVDALGFFPGEDAIPGSDLIPGG
jgi:hypothetical protein